jgi:hypothetical protein
MQNHPNKFIWKFDALVKKKLIEFIVGRVLDLNIIVKSSILISLTIRNRPDKETEANRSMEEF